MNASMQVDPISQREARLTGVLYLVIILSAGFAEGGIRAPVFVEDSPMATLSAIQAAQSFFHWGLILDLLAFVCDALIAVLFYRMLKPVSATLAMMALVLRLIAHPAIASANLLTQAAVVHLVNNDLYVAQLGMESLAVFVHLAMSLHADGYLIAGGFFAVHCVMLGLLIRRSSLLPGLLGWFMVVAGLAYGVNTLGIFLMPESKPVFEAVVVLPAVVAEGGLCLWLLIKGVSLPSGKAKGTELTNGAV